MVDEYKSTKCIDHLFGRDRKMKTRTTTDRLIQRKLKFDRRKSPSTVKVDIENERRILLQVDTIRKWAHEVGRVTRKKPYVNKINRGKRLMFVKEMLEKPVDFWKNAVVWSDEWKLNVFDSDGKVMVWRTPNEEFNRKCTISKMEHGVGLGLFHPSGSWKTVCIGSYQGHTLLSRYFETISTTINQSF